MATGATLCVTLLVHLAAVSRGQKEPSPQTGSEAVQYCGANFTNGGTINSPNYPNVYSNYTNCTYVLKTYPGSVIILAFNDFDLEQNYDFLTIDSDGIPVGRYSGATKPPILTLGSTATLRFTSDYSIVKKGFSISFSTQAATCGGLVVGSGIVRSPGYPAAYSDDLRCVWGLVATQGQKITLDFQSFNIESDYDWLELYDGNTLVASYTGATLPPRATLGFAGRVVFVTDYGEPYRGFAVLHNGFSFTVASAALSCGGLITGSITIQPPKALNRYLANSSCIWTYRAASNAIATRLSFSFYELELYFDWLKIYDGQVLRNSHTGPNLQGPKPITLRSRTITVIFTSDMTIQGGGFYLDFRPVVAS